MKHFGCHKGFQDFETDKASEIVAVVAMPFMQPLDGQHWFQGQ